MLPTSNASRRMWVAPLGLRSAAISQPIRRRHAHMHTSTQPGTIVDVAADLEANFVWAPPLAPQTRNIDVDLASPESILLGEIALLEHKKEAIERVLVDGNEVLEGHGQVHDLQNRRMLTEVFYPTS
ncbi:uncharacterized protein EDB93DRAFT_1254459 [Suillus bovinus]|uniref:uncharacterized protein n=1 Tax=Suillus bovinus TaxID=48563 RepID=UPI001B85EEAB|nr:uncharacterized protein EDB93DRAFT_1254459 [Suillus bovinus]KAG2134568.1 hypothetical protein EDB93DRAFT_1254459 [Suillus bovinus]